MGRDSEEVVGNQNKDMSMLEEVDMKDKLDMEDDKGEAAATLFEDCQSDQLTTDIVENNSGKDEERASPLSYMVGSAQLLEG